MKMGSLGAKSCAGARLAGGRATLSGTVGRTFNVSQVTQRARQLF
jgi:hypothetical protein